MDELLSTLSEERDRLLTLIKGYQDILSLDIVAETRAGAEARLKTVQRRYALLSGVILASTALIEDGYPELPPADLGPGVKGDLGENLAGMELAYADITGEPEGGPFHVGLSSTDIGLLEGVQDKGEGIATKLESLDAERE